MVSLWCLVAHACLAATAARWMPEPRAAETSAVQQQKRRSRCIRASSPADLAAPCQVSQTAVALAGGSIEGEATSIRLRRRTSSLQTQQTWEGSRCGRLGRTGPPRAGCPSGPQDRPRMLRTAALVGEGAALSTIDDNQLCKGSTHAACRRGGPYRTADRRRLTRHL